MFKFISKLSDAEKKIFYIMLIMVLAAAFDRLFLGPTIAKLDVINQEIESEKAAIQSDLKILAYKDQIIKQDQTFEKYYIEGDIDTDIINADFLRAIEKIATASNIVLSKSNPGVIKKSKYYIEYSVGVDCLGKLEDIVKFIHMVNSDASLMRVSKFNMTPKRGVENAVNASLTVVKMVTNSKMVNVEAVK